MGLFNTFGAIRKKGGGLEPVTQAPPSDGLSAYQLWLAAGNTGTMAQYLASLNGSNGTSGWTPILGGELDGTRTLIKVVDWSGGTGTKPATGMYIGTTGYVQAKADAFNFNAVKRVMPFSGVSNAQGIATIDFSSAKFTSPPVVIPLPATTAALSGPTRSTVVANSTTKAQTQIKLETQAILTGVVTLLVGATANILIIET